MTTAPPTRLRRSLGVADAVILGLGAMLGAGVFAAVGPAAEAAGAALLLGLVVAAVVAFCNAASSAQLAAIIPQSGGTYAYGRARLSPFWGWLAGWAFVVGKLASCAAMALTVGAYAAPSLARPVAVGSVAAVTVIDYFGVRKTVTATKVIVAIVIGVLAVVVAAALASDTDPARLAITGATPIGVLRAAGLLFFAFAGYARIATLGEEVNDPQRTIPRAIPLALGLVLAVYLAVALTALLAVGAPTLAEAAAPLAAVVSASPHDQLTPVVRVGAAVASLGVLLSLLVGISRTVFAMAGNGDAPRALATVHPRHAVPHRAELAVGALVATAAALVDLRSAIGFSSFAVLIYYGIANAAALTLRPDERRWPRWIPAVGVVGCAVMAITLPPAAAIAGAAVVATGAAIGLVRGRR